MPPPMRPRRQLTEEEKKNMPKITPKFLKRIFSYLMPYKLRLLIVFLAIIISSLLGVVPSLLTGKMIDDGLYGKNFPVLVTLILISLGVLILSNLITVIETYVNTYVAMHISYDMKNQMYAHLQTMPQSFFTNEKPGDIVTRMTSDINGVSSVLSGTLTSIVSNVVTVVTTLVALFSMNWRLALVGVIVVPLFILPALSALISTIFIEPMFKPYMPGEE